MDRIRVIEASLRIFVCGLISLIPLIGFIPALYTVFAALRLGKRSAQEWNPAAIYARLGLCLAVLSLGITALAGLIVVLHLVPPFGGD